jgi:hypothetical protein
MSHRKGFSGAFKDFSVEGALFSKTSERGFFATPAQEAGVTTASGRAASKPRLARL